MSSNVVTLLTLESSPTSLTIPTSFPVSVFEYKRGISKGHFNRFRPIQSLWRNMGRTVPEGRGLASSSSGKVPLPPSIKLPCC